MTVTTETSSVAYTGNGATMTFAIVFDFADEAEVVVLVGGVVQAQGTVYSVVGANVVFALPPASGASITVRRDVTYTQPTNFRTQGTFSPEVHEAQMDSIVYQTQQLARLLDAATARLEVLEAAGGGGGLTEAQINALILAQLTPHSYVSHCQLDNGMTILTGPGNVFGVQGGNSNLMFLFNNTGSALSLVTDPPLQTIGDGDNNSALVVLVNIGSDAITFNGGSFIILQGGSCTLMQNETLTLAFSGPYLGELWLEVARSRTLVLPP